MTNRSRFIRNCLSATTITTLGLCASAVAVAPNAGPAGGQGVSGTAALTQTPTRTTVIQSTQRAAINWTSFDLGSQHTVQVMAPSSTAVTLMRVTGPNPSELAGRVSSNGVVIITNASGAAFDPGAQVNAGGFIVSASGITNQNFEAGNGSFNGAPRPNAAVTNAGTITVTSPGDAVLLAPTIANSGTISARLGTVDLFAGTAATLNLSTAQASITRPVQRVPLGANGKPVTSLISLAGSIQAAAGHVLIRANAVDGIVQSLVSTTGAIMAPTLGSRAGTIQVNGSGGSILVGGKLQALGPGAGRGGRIGLLATHTVGLAPTGRLSASGGGGGGVIAIGTTLQRGAAPAPAGIPSGTSQRVSIPAGAVITANATNNGTGGRITGLSVQSLTMAGKASVRGGPHGGNGGLIELSTKGTLALTGKTDVSATPPAKPGTVLLDPRRLVL